MRCASWAPAGGERPGCSSRGGSRIAVPASLFFRTLFGHAPHLDACNHVQEGSAVLGRDEERSEVEARPQAGELAVSSEASAVQSRQVDEEGQGGGCRGAGGHWYAGSVETRGGACGGQPCKDP